MYLMIENKGIAPITAFTRLGDSGSRNREGRFIGQFGTGAKHAINIFLRKGIECQICTDGTTLEFYFEVETVTDADGEVRQSYPVKCRTKGKINRTIECGWDLNFGGIDWTDASMGLRELVSNAIDWATACDSTPLVKVEGKVRNKAGHTRIFVSYDSQDVKVFHRDLPKTFLYFSDRPELVNERFLPKNPDTVGPRIYREGVEVRTLDSKVPAVFDYNFQAGEIEIDECRNSSEYALRAKIAQAINKADKATLKTFFAAMAEGDTYEGSLDDFYLGYGTSDDQKDAWKGAWEEVSDGAAIATKVTAQGSLADHAKKKGHKVKGVSSQSFVTVAQKMGVIDVVGILGSEGTGDVEVEATDDAVAAVAEVWGWCDQLDMTKGKPMPEVKSFKNIMDGESSRLGFYRPGTTTVHVREDLAGGICRKVALEEVVHYITGATDMSRDFQNFFIDMIDGICS